MQRTGIQYHWENPGYSTFEDFLSALKQPKRKNIRQATILPLIKPGPSDMPCANQFLTAGVFRRNARPSQLPA